MKVGDTKGVASSGRLSATDKKAGVGAAAYARAADSATKAPALSDIAAILDVPETEFTPKVRGAIMALMAEVEKLRRDLQQKEARIAHLEQLADQDPLTPVQNRRAFVRELTRMMSFADRYDTVSSMIYFDLNGLKPVNDTYGHAAGDAVIAYVARVLVENVREADVVGRLGGDEFGVLLPYTDEGGAMEKAATLAGAVAAKPVDWNGVAIPASVSWGVHTFRSGGSGAHQALDAAAQAIEAADRAMYAQKKYRSEG
ncbi:MAG TPA: GGDEF domain-containing protein [Alphaproteobacteria bacterium]|nr:GGDEF domain-containing protein [Alphaproteobacteria bacterium]